MAALVVIGTYILVSQAYGFDVDKKTGNLIQNGLVFIDSAPDNASIIINGIEQKNRTNARLALPEAKYSIEIRKEGYRSWNRVFELLGGSVERFAYPMLIPTQLNTSELKAQDARPSISMESPDRRWVLVANSGDLTSFTRYDLNELDDQKRPATETINFPSDVFSKANGKHTLELVEWSTDNNNVLVKHSFKGGTEFAILNHQEPDKSANINQRLGVSPDKIVLRDKKPDQYYIYFNRGGQLHTADLKSKLTTPILTGVVSFKPHGDNVLLYAQNASGGKVTKVQLKDGDKNYLIREEPVAKSIPLEIARYDGAWFVVVSSDADRKTYIYKEPAKFLEENPDQKAVPTTILKATGDISMLAFSQNTRFIVANNGQHFSVYDAEEDRNFRYDLKQQFDQSVEPAWIDGHRMVVFNDGKAIIFDYDGINVQTLVDADKVTPVFFSRDYTLMYTLLGKDKSYKFSQTPLRLEEDL